MDKRIDKMTRKNGSINISKYIFIYLVYFNLCRIVFVDIRYDILRTDYNIVRYIKQEER